MAVLRSRKWVENEYLFMGWQRIFHARSQSKMELLKNLHVLALKLPRFLFMCSKHHHFLEKCLGTLSSVSNLQLQACSMSYKKFFGQHPAGFEPTTSRVLFCRRVLYCCATTAAPSLIGFLKTLSHLYC